MALMDDIPRPWEHMALGSVAWLPPTLVPMGKDPVGGPWHAPMHPGLLLLDPKERHGFTGHSEVEQQLGQ